MSFILLILCCGVGLVFILLFALSFKSIPPEERLIVYQAGVFTEIKGPGIAFLLPFIEKGSKINLTDIAPNWRDLSPNEIDQAIKKHLNL